MARYELLPSSFFAKNRENFAAQMKPNSVAIFHSNDLQTRSGDTHFTFRQNADLFYLSGLDQEECILVIYPHCPKGTDYQEVVFTKSTNDYIRVWEGYKYSREQVTQISGVQNVYWLDNKEVLLNDLICLAAHVYINGNENDRAHFESKDKNERFAAEIRQKYPLHQLERSQPILKKLRMYKHQTEVNTLQTACNITEAAFRSVLKHTIPEQNECEVEALITYEYMRRGANGHAYNPIVAGGANTCVLHYNDNCRTLHDGELLLLDIGAEYANYAADMSRTIPVNGRFTDRQKAVYNAVLRVKQFAETQLVAGNYYEPYNAEVGKFMESELIGLGLLDKATIAAQNPAYPAYKRYFPHGTSHHLGLDVHDLCLRSEHFGVGMVLTCEPGIYIPEESIGIRLEDDILISPDGNFNLMRNIPLEADEIETLMNAR